MTIKSEAQRAMFEKAATDPEYAASRGISQDLSREKLLAHAKSGSPSLPPRANDAIEPQAKPRQALRIFGA